MGENEIREIYRYSVQYDLDVFDNQCGPGTDTGFVWIDRGGDYLWLGLSDKIPAEEFELVFGIEDSENIYLDIDPQNENGYDYWYDAWKCKDSENKDRCLYYNAKNGFKKRDIEPWFACNYFSATRFLPKVKEINDSNGDSISLADSGFRECLFRQNVDAAVITFFEGFDACYNSYSPSFISSCGVSSF